MLDLETLGTHPGCVILSIGAVKFDRTGLGKTFYARVDAQSCVDAGLEIDPATVMWWLGQGEAARREVSLPGQPLDEVLEAFLAFYTPGDRVWGNGADFDNAILVEAFLACRLARPWAHKLNRCYRTVRAQYPHPGGVVAHHALEDAKAQALHLITLPYELSPNA